MSRTVTIIGAGPAGMTAALFAAQKDLQVRLIDSNAMVGRKLLVTGSGRANLSNQHMDAARFTCADPEWMRSLILKFGHEDLLHFLENIGVLTYATFDGWCYPLSESAHTVMDAFRNALEISKVKPLLNTKVASINKKEKGFSLRLDSGEALDCNQVIVAAGGKAYPALGSRGELFDSLKNLGHTINPLRPALAPIMCDMRAFKPLIGIRLDAKASLYDGKKMLAESCGNLIFTQWGMNGPAVMNLSHLVSARPGANLELRLDLLHIHAPRLRALFEKQRNTFTPLSVLLGAILPPKVPAVVCAMLGLSSDITVKHLKDEQEEKLFNLLANFPFKVNGVRGFEFCQISAGGVPVNEVDPLSMRSRIVPNLSLAGETLDVIGPCGGYNLQFAFSSGAVAGMNA